MYTLRTALIACAVASPAVAGFTTIDFSVEDDFFTPLVNGQEINNPGEFGILVTFEGLNGDRLAIFDTDPAGPNAGAEDTDLLVGLGNALIVQDDANLTQSTADIFDTPDDEVGGQILMNLVTPGQVGSVDLIDINAGARTIITLTDQNGFQRVYDVPANWTNEAPTIAGFDTLSFLTVADQEGEGSAGPATVTLNEAGYNQNAVASIEFNIQGSGAIDNITIGALIPSPGSFALFAGAGFVAARRRRA
ncbi:MAG: hypothetical protein AAGH64_05380 [Planctomycetota bacterium]